MSLTGGITLTCADEKMRGGLKRMFLINRTALTDSSFTPGVYHDYTAVSVASTSSAANQWHEFEFEDETGSATFETTINDNNTKSIGGTVTVTIPRQEKIKAQRLQEALDSCKLVAICETYQGQSFVYGYDQVIGNYGCEAGVNGTNGPTFDDNNSYEFRLEFRHLEIPRQFYGTIITGNGAVTLTDPS